MAICGLLIICTWGTSQAFAQNELLYDKAIAIVGGRVVTASELRSEVMLFLARYQSLQKAWEYASFVERSTAKSFHSPLEQDVLRMIIQRELFLMEINRLQINTVAESKITEALIRTRSLFKTPRAFVSFLCKAGWLSHESHDQLLQSPSSIPTDAESLRQASELLYFLLEDEEKMNRWVELKIRNNPPPHPSAIRKCYLMRRARLGRLNKDAVMNTMRKMMQVNEATQHLAELAAQMATKTILRFAPGYHVDLERQIESCPSADEILGR